MKTGAPSSTIRSMGIFSARQNWKNSGMRLSMNPTGPEAVVSSISRPYNRDMSTSLLRELLERRPFEPFEVHMSNGEIYQVRYPDVAILLKSKLVIGDPEADKIVILAIS